MSVHDFHCVLISCTQASAIKSGLDLVCLFDIDDSVILRRAEGRTCEFLFNFLIPYPFAFNI